MKAYSVTTDVPHAESGGTQPMKLETSDPNELVNQIVGLANENPGREFVVRITAKEIHTA